MLAKLLQVYDVHFSITSAALCVPVVNVQSLDCYIRNCLLQLP